MFYLKNTKNKLKHKMEFIATLLLEECTMHSSCCCEMCQTCQLFVRPRHAAQRTAMKSGHIVVDDRTPRWKGSLHARLKRGGN